MPLRSEPGRCSEFLRVLPPFSAGLRLRLTPSILLSAGRYLLSPAGLQLLLNRDAIGSVLVLASIGYAAALVCAQCKRRTHDPAQLLVGTEKKSVRNIRENSAITA